MPKLSEKSYAPKAKGDLAAFFASARGTSTDRLAIRPDRFRRTADARPRARRRLSRRRRVRRPRRRTYVGGADAQYLQAFIDPLRQRLLLLQKIVQLELPARPVDGLRDGQRVIEAEVTADGIHLVLD